ncbi:deoxyribose-phosphate aldolase [soil metagenome]
MSQTWTRDRVAALIDHTILKPEATDADVAAVVKEALGLGVYAVCVSPPMVAGAVGASAGALAVATVAGFPSGKHLSAVKAAEAELAVRDGAAEVDMVIDVGAALSGNIAAVGADIAAVRTAIPTAVLKVIVESAALLSLADADTLAAVCRAAEDAGADFVKTSTGFHPAGGASVPAIAVMAETVGGRLGIKASGGIRTAADAVALLDAGATRLGLSASATVLDGLS